MKIAIIAHSLYPIAQPFEGGLESFTHLLCSELIRQGHTVHLYGNADSDPTLNVMPLPNLKRSYTDPGSGGPYPDDGCLGQTEFYSTIINEIRKGDYDVVHNNSLNELAIILGNTLEQPFITTFHTPTFMNLQNGTLAVRPDCRQTFTTVSHRLGEIWSEFIDDFEVVYNGIDIAKWSYGEQPDENVAVWCGRICKEKAPHFAIHTALEKGLTLYLAGPKSNLEYHKEYVEPYIDGEQIIYLGHLDQPALNDLVKRAECFFFTSTWDEPYGLVIAEALACGTPVLGFSIGAAPEILTDACSVLVAPEDQEALTASYDHIKQLNRQDCRQRAEDFCSAESMVNGYLNLYRRLVAQQTFEVVSNRQLAAA